MAIKNQYRLDVPLDERKFITYNDRKTAFKVIYNGYKKRFGLKGVYAYLNTRKSKDEMTDYLIIYQARNDDDTTDIIFYDAVPIWAERCTPAFMYYRRQKKMNNFFQFGLDEMVRISKPRFYEYLTNVLDLSLDKEDQNYWKKPDFTFDVCKGLMDLSMEYRKKNDIGPTDQNQEAPVENGAPKNLYRYLNH